MGKKNWHKVKHSEYDFLIKSLENYTAVLCETRTKESFQDSDRTWKDTSITKTVASIYASPT